MMKELLEEIRECDRERQAVDERREALVHRLHSLETRASKVLKRFQEGDYIVNSSGRHFWCNDGRLLTAVYQDDMEGLEELVRLKVIAKD